MKIAFVYFFSLVFQSSCFWLFLKSLALFLNNSCQITLDNILDAILVSKRKHTEFYNVFEL